MDDKQNNTTSKSTPAPLPTSGGRTVRMVPGRKAGGTRVSREGSASSDTTKGGAERSGAGKARGRGDRTRAPRERSEFDNKLLEVRRVTRVVSGGRRFSFAASVVIGDKKGRVGVGTGKSGDTPLAIEKAVRDAKKHLIKVHTTKNGSIPHEVKEKYASALISIVPVKGGAMTAGSAVRYVLELAGVTGVTGKILSRSKNKTNIARATVKALNTIKK